MVFFAQTPPPPHPHQRWTLPERGKGWWKEQNNLSLNREFSITVTDQILKEIGWITTKIQRYEHKWWKIITLDDDHGWRTERQLVREKITLQVSISWTGKFRNNFSIAGEKQCISFASLSTLKTNSVDQFDISHHWTP